MTKVRISTRGFIIIWVSSIYSPTVLQHRLLGRDIYLVLCTAEQLDEVRDKFPRNKVIFSDDHEEAFRLAGEFAQLHLDEQRSRVVSTTAYCHIAPAA